MNRVQAHIEDTPPLGPREGAARVA